MDKNIYLKKKLASSWFSLLQKIYCHEFEKFEVNYGKKTKQKPKYFKLKNWKKSKIKNEGGGTYSMISNVLVFDGVGVNLPDTSEKFTPTLSNTRPLLIIE
jgi:coproporphyrinogen III oxidase